MTDSTFIQIGVADGKPIAQAAAMLNRHGLISGATGTGKTVTLQVLAEGLSALGVPVFTADVKGDLSGLANPGKSSPRLEERIERLGLRNHSFSGFPLAFWDLFGKTGIPVRLTISELGPLLLSRLLELNDTQTGVLYATFKIADDHGLLLLDLADLRAMLSWVGENAQDLKLEYGNLSPTSVAAIQRNLLVLDSQGAQHLFGEPALEIKDLIATDAHGRGVINVLDASALIANAPQLYACFLFWLLSELFEDLPERGDADKPIFVLFFDEAHLLFKDAPKSLLDKIEQVVRLIRSKGVGVFFVTQSPLDIPEAVLGQLGLKIQHALRAFTPKDQKTVRIVAESFRANPQFATVEVITALATGEALVSLLDENGQPTPVARTLINPPQAQIGPIDELRRRELNESSPLTDRYSATVNRESAYEKLNARAERKSAGPAPQDDTTSSAPRPATTPSGAGSAPAHRVRPNASPPAKSCSRVSCGRSAASWEASSDVRL